MGERPRALSWVGGVRQTAGQDTKAAAQGVLGQKRPPLWDRRGGSRGHRSQRTKCCLGVLGSVRGAPSLSYSSPARAPHPLQPPREDAQTPSVSPVLARPCFSNCRIPVGSGNGQGCWPQGSKTRQGRGAGVGATATAQRDSQVPRRATGAWPGRPLWGERARAVTEVNVGVVTREPQAGSTKAGCGETSDPGLVSGTPGLGRTGWG